MTTKQQETIQEAMKRQVKEREEQFGTYVGTKELIEDVDSVTLTGSEIIDRDEDEIQHHQAELAHQDLMEMMSFNQEDR